MLHGKRVLGFGRNAALAALFALLLSGLPARAALLLNLSTTYSDPSQVYVLFQGNQAKFSASYVDATTQQTVQMSLNTHGISSSIALSSIKGGVITVTEFVSGVIYASVGGPLGTASAPAPTNSGDPGYNIPWQSVAEITYSGAPADSGDITAIQFFALSSAVQVLGGTSGTKVLQSGGFNMPGATLLNQIAALSSTPNAVVIKSTKAANLGQIVRVLAPNQFGGAKDSKGTSYFSIGGFPSFQAYVQAQHQDGATAQIKGSVNGNAYIFTASVDAANNIVATGSYGTGATYTITVPADAPLTDGSGLTNYVQSWTIYACVNGAVVVNSSDGSTINASVLTQVMHDLASGYNFGFVDSPTIDPVTHVPFGTETSNLWFKDSTPATLYAGLQPNHPYYNQYSALISSASNGSVYGFPYADAVPGVTLDTVVVTGSPSQNVTAWNIIIGDPSTTDTPVMPPVAMVVLAVGLCGVAALSFRRANAS